MKSSSLTPLALVPLFMATFSLISMISLLQIDRMVNGGLYAYGLQFNYAWAEPYRLMTGLIFAMGWFNVIAAMVFQVYVVNFERRHYKMFANAVTSEVMKNRRQLVEAIRETRQREETTPKPQMPKETASLPPSSAHEAVQKDRPEAQTVAHGDSSEETRTSNPADQETRQSEKPEEPQTKPQSNETESQTQSEPQKSETKPETAEDKKERPIIVGIPEEELDAPQ